MFKRAEGPYKRRVQITFGAACPTAPPRGCHRWRGLSVLRRISCNPIVAWGLFSFSHVSLALERGSLYPCCTASRPHPSPAPAAEHCWLQAPVPSPPWETANLRAEEQDLGGGSAPEFEGPLGRLNEHLELGATQVLLWGASPVGLFFFIVICVLGFHFCSLFLFFLAALLR